MDTSWQCTFWPLRSGAASGRWTVNVGGRAKAVPNQKGASQIDSTWSARLEGLIPSDRSQYHLHGILHKPPTPPSIATPSYAARLWNAARLGTRITARTSSRSPPLQSSRAHLGCPPPLSGEKGPCPADHHLKGPRSPPTCAHLCGVAASGPRSLSSSLCSPMRCRRRRGHVERRWWRG